MGGYTIQNQSSLHFLTCTVVSWVDVFTENNIVRRFQIRAKYNQNNKTYQFWKRGNHPVELISPKWIMQKMHYIHPVKAAGKSGIIEIDDFGSSIGYIYV